MVPVWIDTDIGDDIDDAVALLCALRHPEIDVVGISTVFRRVELRAWLAREILARAGAPRVPVLPGAMATFDGRHDDRNDVPAQAHLAPPLESLSPEEDEARIQSLAQAMIAVPGRFHLVTIGALTNAARLADRHPGIAGRWASVTCMAGQLERGVEYNIQCDPSAARLVFERLSPRVVGIEACRDVLTRDEAEAALDPGDPACSFLLDCYRLYREQPGWHPDPETAPLTLFDAITLLSLVREDLFPFQDLRLFVEKDGRLRLTDDGAPVKYAASSDWAAIKPIITGLLRGD
ncbi:MAG TPA: nucleoside hydrolase [Armatimonadota bacterium]|nr:nucleoside hydrolase [Armatimonadota bacterium]